MKRYRVTLERRLRATVEWNAPNAETAKSEAVRCVDESTLSWNHDSTVGLGSEELPQRRGEKP